MKTDFNGILREVLISCRGGVIAVSGGVDSMTLSAFAHKILGAEGIRLIHASSPAVPAAATSRIHEYSAKNGWNLHVVNAGEFADSSYLSNPINGPNLDVLLIHVHLALF